MDKYCPVSKLCMYTSGFVSPWHIVLAHKQAMLEKTLDDLHVIILKVTLKRLAGIINWNLYF